jgi:hypothetical protein
MEKLAPSDCDIQLIIGESESKLKQVANTDDLDFDLADHGGFAVGVNRYIFS